MSFLYIQVWKIEIDKNFILSVKNVSQRTIQNKINESLIKKGKIDFYLNKDVNRNFFDDLEIFWSNISGYFLLDRTATDVWIQPLHWLLPTSAGRFSKKNTISLKWTLFSRMMWSLRLIFPAYIAWMWQE